MEILAFTAVFKGSATQRAIYYYLDSVVDSASFAIWILKIYLKQY